MAEKLADYVVGLGLKGQNVALLEINKAKKAGKELTKQKNKINLADVKGANVARQQLQATKQLTKQKNKINLADVKGANVARQQLQATKQQTQAIAAQAKIQRQGPTITEHAQGVGRTGVSGLSTAMTSGASGLASSLPGIGALFGAASSAVELAGQEYIAGVTASKNINLVTQNYSRAFQGAFSTGVDKAVKSTSGVFAGRTGKAFVTSLADQGVTAKSLQRAIPALNQLANAQGVGSIDELMGRLQSGTLKEGAGLSKADIVLLQSQSQLLNNRFTSDVGAQMLTQTLGRLSPGMQKSAAQTSGITRMAGGESLLRDREESFRGEGANTDAAAVNSMYAARRTDRQLRQTLLPLSMAINGVTSGVVNRGKKTFDKVKEGKYAEAANEALNIFDPNRAALQEAAKKKAEAESVGPMSMQSDSTNNDIMRSGRAIADTLRDINNQLNVMRAQMRRA